MRRILWPLILVFLAACASQGEKPLSEQSVKQLRSELTAKHPAAYFYLADVLFEQGKEDEAAIMFYVGQIRYRAYINTLRTQPAASEETTYEALKNDVGEEINLYAARNLDNWIRLLEQAVVWHNQHPNEFLPKEDYSLLYELTIYNFNKLKEYISDNKQLIRAQRAQQGLENEY